MRKYTVIAMFSIGLALWGCRNEEKEAKMQSEEADGGENSGTEEENPGYTDAVQDGPYGRISITLPEGWSYEACPMDSERLISGMYGIHFYPDGITDGSIELVYMDSFGVCGTGLEEETVTIAGNSANIGTYDGHAYWDFVSFQGECEGIVALTYSVEEWWDEYADQVTDILDTLSFDPSVKEGGAYVYDAESELDEVGLYFTLENVSSTGATLVFNQYDTQAPTGELQFGEDFGIEIWRNGNWEEAPIVVEGDYGFNAVAYMIKSGDQTKLEMSWEWLYGKLPPGEYRLGKSVDDFRKSGDYDKYTVYAHFILN